MIDEADKVRTVAVLAGRRADAPDQQWPALPEAAREPVRAAVRALLVQHDVDLLVAAAACGADLLGLQAASDLGRRTRIVLPFSVERFRAESVTDRGGDWGAIYDHLVSHAAVRGDLLVHRQDSASDPFAANNETLLRDALEADASRRIAIIVWDGQPRGPDDATADMARRARAKELEVFELSPLELLR